MSPILIDVLFCLVIIIVWNLVKSDSFHQVSYLETENELKSVVISQPKRMPIEENFIQMLINAPNNVFLEASRCGMGKIIINDTIKELYISQRYSSDDCGTISITDWRTNRHDSIEMSDDEIKVLKQKFNIIEEEVYIRQKNENLSVSKPETYEVKYTKKPRLYIVD